MQISTSENEIIANKARNLLGGGSFLIIAFLIMLAYVGIGQLDHRQYTDNVTQDSVIGQPAVSGIAIPDETQARTVLEVVDGDTLSLATNNNGKPEKIRLIGIDTPELKGSNGQADCFAVHAKLALEQEISSHKVYLETDPSQGLLDKYGRTLAYVSLISAEQGKVDLNLFQITAGNAVEYTYSKAYKYQSSYRQAQQKAKSSGIGMWSACKIG